MMALPVSILAGLTIQAVAQSASEELVNDLPIRPLTQVLTKDSLSLIPKFEYTLADGTTVSFSGQLNSGLLYYDDGFQSFTNFPVNNDNSSSRARLEAKKEINDWLIHGTFEVEYQPLASNVANQFNDTPNWDFEWTNIRKLEVVVGNEQYGKLWVGQAAKMAMKSARFLASQPAFSFGWFVSYDEVEDDGLRVTRLRSGEWRTARSVS